MLLTTCSENVRCPECDNVPMMNLLMYLGTAVFV